MSGLIATLGRRAKLACVVLCGTVAVVMVASLIQERRYSVESSLLFRDPRFAEQLFRTSPAPVEDEERAAATNLELVSLPVIAERTASGLGAGWSADDVEDAIVFTPEGQADVITVRATWTDPETASEIANEFARHYIEFRRDADRTRIADARELVEQDLQSLPPSERRGLTGRSIQRQINELRALEALQTGNAELVQEASADRASVSPNLVRNGVLAVVLGGLLAVVVAVIRDHLDRRVRSVDEFGQRLSLPVLATIPATSALASQEPQSSNGVESDGGVARQGFLMLQAQLRYFNTDKEVRAILITSATSNEGKTTVARYLAESISAAGQSAVTVAADLHRPSLAQRIGVPTAPGLAEYLSGQCELEDALRQYPVKLGNNDGDQVITGVVPAGGSAPNPSGLLESGRMSELISALRDQYEMIVIDSPPLLQVADAIPIMQLVDGVLIVAAHGQTTEDDLAALSAQLAQLNAPALGVVVNRVLARRGGKYAYEYGYGYGA